MGTTIDRAIEIDVPVRIVYDQWTQFEDFPLFMDNVDEVEQISKDQMIWHTKVRGVDREWRAQVTEQIPDKRIAWKSVEGPDHAGVVTFHRIDDGRCRLMLQFRYEPEGFLESYADAVGLVENWVGDELEAFKAFIEKRGRTTGEWRGEIDAHADDDDERGRESDREDERDRKVNRESDREDERDRKVNRESDRESDRESETTQVTTERNDDVTHDDEHRAVDHRATA